MINHTNNINQKELFAKELLGLKPNVTAGDRQEALRQVEVKNVSTISRYLNGDVRNLDVAAQLLSFFRNRIAERAKVLA